MFANGVHDAVSVFLVVADVVDDASVVADCADVVNNADGDDGVYGVVVLVWYKLLVFLHAGVLKRVGGLCS